MEGMVVLGWVFPKTRVSNKGSYAYINSSFWEVSSESRSGTGTSETRKNGKSIQGCVNELVTAVGYWSSVLLEALRRDVHNNFRIDHLK